MTKLDYLIQQSERILDEQQKLRRDVAELRYALALVSEKTRRQERRFDEVEHRIVETKDDLELMISALLLRRAEDLEPDGVSPSVSLPHPLS